MPFAFLVLLSWNSWWLIFPPARFVYLVLVPSLLECTFHCSSVLTAAFVSAVFQPGSWKTPGSLLRLMMDEFLLTSWHIYRWHHLWYLYVAALLSSSSVVTVSLFVSYLHPPLLLLAGRLGADKFGREQAKGGQPRSLCVYIEERETCRGGGEVATTDTVTGWRGAKNKELCICFMVLQH